MNTSLKVFTGAIKAVDAPSDSEWLMVIEARPSTPAIDRTNESTDAASFLACMPKYMQNPVMMFNHDPAATIGKTLRYWKDDDGNPVVEQGIARTERGAEVAQLIRQGVVTTMSFMFRGEYSEAPDKSHYILTVKEIYEIGPVSVPANPEAIIQAAKRLSIEPPEQKPLDNSEGAREAFMSNLNLDPAFKELEGIVGSNKSAVEKVQEEAAQLKSRQDEMQKLLRSVEEKAADERKGLISKEEFKTFSEKIGADILNLSQQIQTSINAKKEIAGQFEFADWKGMKGGFNFVNDDKGTPMPERDQKAFRLFNLPVKYQGNDGEFLKMVRDLHDHVLVCKTAMQYRNPRFNPVGLKTYQLLHELVGRMDPEFAKAMYSTGAGVGDEWVPTQWGGEFETLYRLAATLENRFRTWDMPSQPAYWPIHTSGAVAYRYGEAATNLPQMLLGTDIGTSNILFSAEGFATLVRISPEFIEDAIVAVVPLVREESVVGMQEAFEEALVNGDTTATHQDKVYGGTTTKSSTDPYVECMFIGLRKQASTDSKTFSTASTSSGVGDATAAFAALDVRYCRKLMGIMGLNTQEVFYLTSPAGYYKMLGFTEVATVEKFGANATWLTGMLAALDGCGIHVSAKVREDYNTSGVYDGSTLTQTIVAAVNPRGFRIGQRRGITLETDKNITTQQIPFVSTARKTFKKIAPSTRYPVALGYAITS